MRTVLLSMALSSLLVASSAWSDEVMQRNTFTQTYKVTTQSPTLEVSNIWGDIRVQPGEQGQIVVNVKEERKAANQRDYDRSLELIQLNVDASEQGVSMRVGSPEDRWNNSMNCRGCRVDYQFEIEVPPNATIDVSTVNDGAIKVRSVSGVVSANNVNGPIEVTDIRDCSGIRTVNGPIAVSFASSPSKDCAFETINGDVTISIPSGSAFEVSTDLFNGDIYSEPPVKPMVRTAQVDRIEKKGKNTFVIRKNNGFRIGTGGPLYSVKSMNGDFSIQKVQ